MSFNLTPDLTQNDLLRLEALRLTRLRSLFASALMFCLLQLDARNTLKIHCSEAWMVDHLLNRLDQLRWYAWTVTGAHRVSIYFLQEEIYTSICCPYPATHKLSP